VILLTRPLIITLFVVTFIIETLFEIKSLEYVEGMLAVTALLISFRDARRMFQIVSMLFIAAGTVCVLWGNVSFVQLPGMFAANAMLISLLYMLPYVNRAMRLGGYDRHLGRFLQMRSTNLGHLYVRSVLISYVLSVFLFFAALPFMHRVLHKYFKKGNDGGDSDLAKRFIGMSVLRGFAAVAIWSPIEPLVAMGLVLTGVSYLALLPWLLAISGIVFALGMLWSLPFRGIPLELSNVEAPMPPSYSKAFSLILGLFLLIGSAELLHLLTTMSFFEAMALVLLPYSLLWAASLKRFFRFVAITRRQWKENAENLRHMLVLFVSFGFFNSAVAQSPLLDMVGGPIQGLSAWPVFFLLVIFLVSFALPIAGIHPFVTIGVLGVFVQPALSTINPMSVALVLITGALTSASMGAFNSTVTIMSGILKVNPYRITVWNAGFGFMIGAVGYVASLLLL
jgi:hypothetical protein